MEKWKAVCLDILKGTVKTQLFDLNTDTQEQHDVAAQHPEIINQMEAIMKKDHYTPEVTKFRMEALENN